MKEIQLSKQGKRKGMHVAIVDDDDFEYLNQWRWNYHNSGYACRTVKCTTILMHRLIMNTAKEEEVDHIDHNRLNNQRCNLRLCNDSENKKNRTPSGKIKYLGVSYYTGTDLLRATIVVDKKQISLGYFHNSIDAAKAYDTAAKKYHGEFANLNFK